MLLLVTIEGNALFYNRDKGTDLWMLADPHHIARVVPSSGFGEASPGLLTPSVISLAGWGVRIFEGERDTRTEIPEAPVKMPKPNEDAERLPSVSYFNTDKTIRPDLVAAVPEDMPAALNSMIRLRNGTVKHLPPDNEAKYGESDWDFGIGPVRKLTHRFEYAVEVAREPISLVFTRGKQEEWIELKSREFEPGKFRVELTVTIDDVKEHENIKETNTVASLLEWRLHHRCFVKPDSVVPTTARIRVEPDGETDTGTGGTSTGGADPMCPGGQIP